VILVEVILVDSTFGTIIAVFDDHELDRIRVWISARILRVSHISSGILNIQHTYRLCFCGLRWALQTWMSE
jgi:hypothetical protein